MSLPGISILSSRPNLLVRDIEASVAFYRDVLGFETKAMMGEPPNFALLQAGGGEIAVNKHDEPQASGCYIYVTGVEALHERCVDQGVTVTYPLTLEAWGLLNFVIAEPDGHQIATGERNGSGRPSFEPKRFADQFALLASRRAALRFRWLRHVRRLFLLWLLNWHRCLSFRYLVCARACFVISPLLHVPSACLPRAVLVCE